VRILWIITLFLLSCGNGWEKEVATLIQRGNHEKAERMLLAHGDEAPFRVAYWRGVLAMAKGEWRNALAAFEEAAADSSLRKDLVQHLWTLADTARKLRLERVAVRAYELLDRLEPKAVGLDGLLFLARSAWEWNQSERAREYLERYLAEGGSLSRIAGLYFPILFDLRKTDRLLALGESLKEFDDADALWAYGNALMEKAMELYSAGDVKAAEQHLQRLVSLQGPTALLDDAYALLGDIALQGGDTARARRFYEQALLYALPRSPLAQEIREKLRNLAEY